jgi:hypothetical protein
MPTTSEGSGMQKKKKKKNTKRWNWLQEQRSDDRKSRRNFERVATSFRRRLLLRIRTLAYLQNWLRRDAGPVGQAVGPDEVAPS